MLEVQGTEKLCPSPGVDAVDGDADGSSTGKPSDYYSSADLPDEIDDLIPNKQRESVLTWTQWFVYVCIILSWFFGKFGFSIGWIILLIVFVHIVYSGTFFRIVEDCLTYEKRQLQRKRAFNCAETAEWLNFLLNRWWLYSSSSGFTWIKSNVDPLLKEGKPNYFESLTLKALDLGKNTPFITTVRSYDLNTRKSNASSITSPSNASSPSVIAGLLRYRLMLEADVGITCPEFKMTLRGKMPGMELDFMIERLSMSGKTQIIGQFGLDVPFPHIHKLSFKFVEKPKVDFVVTALGLTQGLDIIGVKTAVQSLVMNALTNTVVDPNEWTLNIDVNDYLLPAPIQRNYLAVGIIRVTIGWLQNSGKCPLITKSEEERWCVLKVGTQSYRTCSSSPTSYQWEDQHAFLIESRSDRLIIKIKKKKKFVGHSTMVTFDESIDSYLTDGSLTYEGQLEKKGVGLKLKLDHFSIKPLRRPISFCDGLNRGVDQVDGVDETDSSTPKDEGVAGILYICIHGAEGIPNPHLKRLPNPYCAVFHNNKKIKTTHYVSQSTNPTWDSEIEFLVSDYTQANVTIAICNWDSSKMADAGILGLATAKSLNLGEYERIKETIVLESSVEGLNIPASKQCGTITITTIFRPAPFINLQGPPIDKGSTIKGRNDEDSEMKSKSMDGHLVNALKPVLLNGFDFHGDGTGLGLMEVVILRARNLIAKDLNGFSDPFCEIRINDEYYCKTTVKKRTLNPCWDEKLTIRLPGNGDSFSVVVWDDDTFGKDFLGSISFKDEDVRRLAIQDTSEWFALKETKSGEIEMRFRIISESFENSEMIAHSSKASLTGVKHSPNLNSFKSRPNFYGEDVTDAIPFTSNDCNGHLDEPPPIPDLPPKTKSQTVGSSSPALSIARTGSSASRTNGSDSPHPSTRSATNSLTASLTQPTSSSSNVPLHNMYDFVKPKASPSKSKTPTLTAVPIPIPPERKSSLPTTVSPVTPETVSPTNGTSPTETEASPLSRGSPAYSSFHEMKRKMKKTFAHPLRRFRSEACVHEDKSKNFKDRVSIKTHEDVYSSCSNIEKLADELNTSPTGDSTNSPTAPKTVLEIAKPLRYYNIQGTVVQASGIDLPKETQLCCRVRLLPCAKPNKGSKFSPKTISKSKYQPSSPNPVFNLEFLLDLPNGIPCTFSLSFEIRKSNKEIVSSKSITLQDLFEDATEESDEMRTCLSLSSGATLEVVLSHGKENGEQAKSQKSSSRLLRSWSVHRIGKI